MNHNAGFLNAVIVTVCTPPEVTRALVQVFEKRAWMLSFSHLDAYISSARRPSFGPQIKSATACVAFVDFDKDPEEAVETTQYLTQTFAGKVTVIAIASYPERTTILTAMRAGCSEFLSQPINEAALTAMLDRLEKVWSASILESTKSGAVLSFLGVKGGVGTTTLAVHLAMYLVQCHKKRVLLIDHHPELGHVCVYLGMDGSNYHFHEVVRNVGRLDSELLRGFVAKHSSGLDVLSSPDVTGGMKPMDVDSMVRTLEFLRSEYDFVVVDCDIAQEELNRPFVLASTFRYLVSTPEVGSIRDLSRYVDKLILIEDSSEKLQVVINRSTSPFAIPMEQIERAMKLPVSIRIPNSYPDLVRSENLGEPIPPASALPFAAAFVHWVDALTGASSRKVAAKKERGFLGLWKQSVIAH